MEFKRFFFTVVLWSLLPAAPTAAASGGFRPGDGRARSREVLVLPTQLRRHERPAAGPRKSLSEPAAAGARRAPPLPLCALAGRRSRFRAFAAADRSRKNPYGGSAGGCPRSCSCLCPRCSDRCT